MCDEYMELISADLDGEVTGTQAAALRAHLNECESCRRYAAALRALTALSAEALETPPATLSENVMARVRSQAPDRKRRSPPRLWRVTRYAGLAAALCLVVWAGFRFAAPRGKAETPSMMFAATGAQSAAFDQAASEEAAPEAAPAEAAPQAPVPDARDGGALAEANDGALLMAAAPQPCMAEITDAAGTLWATQDADTLAFLTGTLLALGEGEPLEIAADADYTLLLYMQGATAPETYSLWIQDGALYWQAPLENEALPSSAAAGELTDILTAPD